MKVNKGQNLSQSSASNILDLNCHLCWYVTKNTNLRPLPTKMIVTKSVKYMNSHHRITAGRIGVLSVSSRSLLGQINSHRTHILTQTGYHKTFGAEQSGDPILSRVMTGAVLHGHVSWLDCHLEGCLWRPQGHQIQFTWRKKNTKQQEKQHALHRFRSPSHTHLHTDVHQSHLFQAGHSICSPVERYFPAPPFSQRTHLEPDWTVLGRKSERRGAKSGGQKRWGESLMWSVGSIFKRSQELYKDSTAPCWPQRKASTSQPSVMSSLCTLWRVFWVFMLLCTASSCSCVSPLKCLLTPKPAALSLQNPPKNPRQSLFDCWSKYAVSPRDNKACNPPALQSAAQHSVCIHTHKRLELQPPTAAAPLFKLRSCKHGASLRLCALSFGRPSDCCGEVFLREYHPRHVYTQTHTCVCEFTNIYTWKHAKHGPAQI